MLFCNSGGTLFNITCQDFQNSIEDKPCTWTLFPSLSVTLLRRPKPLLNREQTATFTRIVKRAFSQRRKMMLKLLREDWPHDWLIRLFTAGGLAMDVRAERVGLHEFVRLAELLHSNLDSDHV